MVLLRLTHSPPQECVLEEMGEPDTAAADAPELASDRVPTELKGDRWLADPIGSNQVDLQSRWDAEEATNWAAIQGTIRRDVEEGHLPQERADWLLEGMEVGFASVR